MSGYGKDLSALGPLLLSESPRVIYLGEDRIHTPRQSTDAVSKEKGSSTSNDSRSTEIS